ncbi:MAG: exosortase C-terminal domain/associated protein EpsI [Pyrinomonadaceae bacterium]
MESRYLISNAWKPTLIAAGLLFMYAGVLWKLGFDWWTDDNYSHGLIIPFVVGYIVWQRIGRIKAAITGPDGLLGWIMIAAATLMLLAGTLASVIFAQRISLLVMIAGVVTCCWGARALRSLFVPFILLALSIPIPQLIFNKIALPLQILASRLADNGIRALGISTARIGNVIEIPYRITGEIIGLEVVEACSGIRSLMTLITLSLILGYFTRDRLHNDQHGLKGLMIDRDVQRTVLLMVAAVPVALITNAARVIVTGVIAYYFGYDGVEGTWHDVSGSFVFLAALAILFGLNIVLRRIFRGTGPEGEMLLDTRSAAESTTSQRVIVIFGVIVFCGVFVNWFQYRGEIHVARRPLSEIPARLGNWEQRNADIRFDAETEKVLRASDYVMRDYYGPGKRLNLYVGYYGSQRTGATYHSPLSCLPGTGWEMADRQLLEIETSRGRRFTVNRYIVRRGEHKEYLIYWYQGRGRTFASEYMDKLYTSVDSVTRRRSDGGMVRIMTPFGKDPDHSLAAAIDLTKHVADNIGEFLPD